jgi:hypothetical protein
VYVPAGNERLLVVKFDDEVSVIGRAPGKSRLAPVAERTAMVTSSALIGAEDLTEALAVTGLPEVAAAELRDSAVTVTEEDRLVWLPAQAAPVASGTLTTARDVAAMNVRLEASRGKRREVLCLPAEWRME